jgi:hypothetical protein
MCNVSGSKRCKQPAEVLADHFVIDTYLLGMRTVAQLAYTEWERKLYKARFDWLGFFS